MKNGGKIKSFAFIILFSVDNNKNKVFLNNQTKLLFIHYH